jgi:hypothetical protein
MGIGTTLPFGRGQQFESSSTTVGAPETCRCPGVQPWLRQNGQVDSFDIGRLSGQDFEVLCRDLFEDILGVPLEIFPAGKDHGIDLRHVTVDGHSTVIQCKHWSRSGRATLLDRIRKDERPRVEALHPDRYLLATTVELTVAAKATLLEHLSPYVKTPGDLYGIDQIAEELRKRPGLVRRHFRLWMTGTAAMESVLHRNILVRSSDLLDELEECERTFVPTAAYDRACALLRNQSVCLLAGIPGIGKTTIAKMLAKHCVDEGYELVEVSRDVDELNSAWLEGTDQVFYYDDFLGQTTLEHKLNKNEDSRLIKAMHRVRRTPGKRLLLTTREYILAQARQRYEKLDGEQFEPVTCTVELLQISGEIRAEILYNHLQHSTLSADEKKQIAQPAVWRRIIHHANFNPRLIASTIRIAARSGDAARALVQNLENPERLWEHIVEDELDDAAVHLLEVLATFSFSTPLDTLRKAWHDYTAKIGEIPDRRRFTRALKILEGSLIKIDLGNTVFENGQLHQLRMVDFHNPSIKDHMQARMSKGLVNVADLLDSMNFREQAAHMVSLATSVAPDGLAMGLDRHRLAIAQAVIRTFEDVETSPSEEDDSWAENLSRTLQVAENLRSAELTRFIVDRIDSHPARLLESHFSHLATLATEVHQNTFVADNDGLWLIRKILDVISADPAPQVRAEEWMNLVDIEAILASVPGDEAFERRSRLRRAMADRAYEELATYWPPDRTEATNADDFDDWSRVQTEAMLGFLDSTSMTDEVRRSYDAAKSVFGDWERELGTEAVAPEPLGEISALRRTAPAPTPAEASQDKAERLRRLLE